MTNNEIADGLESKHMGVFGEAVNEAVRRLRELPDPAPSEPEYGWDGLVEDLSEYVNWDAYNKTPGDCRPDLLRGTCVRLMREKGWNASYAKPAPMVGKPGEFFWAYAKTMMDWNSECSDYAPSEPAAYRDMLKHAGVI